ncbi:MAG: DUF433 domain-containing protein [Alphaproteobacteria bacterium]|jgi:uncharacterized protein (DUF433 family)|nr:DUF433 domain-containing protein [Alphaproteobacteria bacterium]
MTTLVAFADTHVAQLTGLSRRQLREWNRKGFFTPHYGDDGLRGPQSRLYSFPDVVCLRLIAMLRRDHRIPFDVLADIRDALTARDFDAWNDLVLHINGRRVELLEAGDDEAAPAANGESRIIRVAEVRAALSEAAETLKCRSPDELGKIKRSRRIMHNAPVFAGTRIPVAMVRRYLEAGFTSERILSDYPTLTPHDIEAAIEYESRLAEARKNH